MSKNNYFYYTDHHYDFLYYLLSFAMEQYQEEDPLLSDCAKELIRYILEMDKMEPVVVTNYDTFAVTVNHNKFMQWQEDDYRRFVLHLVEDSIIDLTGRIDGVRVFWERNPLYTRGLHWYFITDDKLEKMGVRKHIDAIYLHTRTNTINICFEPSGENYDLYVQKLRNFVKNICPMPIFLI